MKSTIALLLLFIFSISSGYAQSCDLAEFRKQVHQKFVKEMGMTYGGYYDHKATSRARRVMDIDVRSTRKFIVVVTGSSKCRPMFTVLDPSNTNSNYTSNIYASHTDSETVRINRDDENCYIYTSKVFEMPGGKTATFNFGADRSCSNWQGGEYNLMIFWK